MKKLKAGNIFSEMEKQIKFIENNLFFVSPYMTPDSVNDFYNIVCTAKEGLYRNRSEGE